MHEAVIAIAREGVSPIVRIPANEAWMVKSKLSDRAWLSDEYIHYMTIMHHT